MSKTAEELIAAYVKVRDKKAELEAAHKEAVAKYNEVLKTIEVSLLAKMNEVGTDSFKGASGTAFKSERSTAVVEDREAFLNFVRDNGAWDLLEARAGKTAVDAYTEEHGEYPPGVNMNRAITINVRRPT